MGIPSLHDVMNTLVMGDRIRDDIVRVSSDIDAFRAQDDLFNQLYKIWLDADANLARVIKREGQNAPLADVALYQMQSAEAAWQARLIELRAQDAATQKAIALESEEIQQKKANDKAQAKELRRLQDWEKRLEQEATAKREKESSLFWLLLLSLMLAQGYDRPYPPPHLRHRPAF